RTSHVARRHLDEPSQSPISFHLSISLLFSSLPSSRRSIMNFFSTDKDLFSLPRIRDILIRLEDTIIFGILSNLFPPVDALTCFRGTHADPNPPSPAALIERAQFALNSAIYQPNAPQFKDVTDNRSFLEYFLWETEKVHAKVRRYSSPDEYAFTSPLPAPIISTLDYPSFLYPNDINVNPQILSCYLDHIVGAVAKPGDDQQYGSATTRDVEVLQALSKRIHYGKFIAECKFRESPSAYAELARTKNLEGIEALLTNKEVEASLLNRLRRKALIYGQSLDDADEDRSAHLRIPVEAVVGLYEKWVIPLTKFVEVEYLVIRGREWKGEGEKEQW
ncbi:chorismate mutase, partial [Endogone sp. FLAS-F59071]